VQRITLCWLLPTCHAMHRTSKIRKGPVKRQLRMALRLVLGMVKQRSILCTARLEHHRTPQARWLIAAVGGQVPNIAFLQLPRLSSNPRSCPPAGDTRSEARPCQVSVKIRGKRSNHKKSNLPLYSVQLPSAFSSQNPNAADEHDRLNMGALASYHRLLQTTKTQGVFTTTRHRALLRLLSAH
jgi:hypothetical protein